MSTLSNFVNSNKATIKENSQFMFNGIVESRNGQAVRIDEETCYPVIVYLSKGNPVAWYDVENYRGYCK